MRERGYYWCCARLEDWDIYYWNGNVFESFNCKDIQPDQMDQINESRILNPDEL